MGETTEVFSSYVAAKIKPCVLTLSAYRDKLEVATNSDQIAFQVVN